MLNIYITIFPLFCIIYVSNHMICTYLFTRCVLGSTPQFVHLLLLYIYVFCINFCRSWQTSFSVAIKCIVFIQLTFLYNTEHVRVWNSSSSYGCEHKCITRSIESNQYVYIRFVLFKRFLLPKIMVLLTNIQTK